MSIFGALGSIAGSYFGPIGTTIGGSLGTAIDGIQGRQDQKDTNAQNAEQAQLNRDFQERMSSTSYQRGVKDMEAAGLNPMLAYSQGGASTPNGATSAPMQNKMQAGMTTANQSAQTMSALQSLDNNKALLEQTKAQTDKIRSETLDNTVATAYQKAQLDKLLADTENVDANTSNQKADWKGKVADSGSKYELWDQRLQKGAFSAKASQEVAENQLTQMEIPKSQAEADFWKSTTTLNPWLKTIMMMLQAGHSAAGLGRVLK